MENKPSDFKNEKIVIISNGYPDIQFILDELYSTIRDCSNEHKPTN